jgi:hypothetical protein
VPEVVEPETVLRSRQCRWDPVLGIADDGGPEVSPVEVAVAHRPTFRARENERVRRRILDAGEMVLDPSGYGSGTVIQGLRSAVASAITASSARSSQLPDERAARRSRACGLNPNFKVAANSQPNMHFSLSGDMIGLADLVTMLDQHGIQHVATKIAYREI